MSPKHFIQFTFKIVLSIFPYSTKYTKLYLSHKGQTNMFYKNQTILKCCASVNLHLLFRSCLVILQQSCRTFSYFRAKKKSFNIHHIQTCSALLVVLCCPSSYSFIFGLIKWCSLAPIYTSDSPAVSLAVSTPAVILCRETAAANCNCSSFISLWHISILRSIAIHTVQNKTNLL